MSYKIHFTADHRLDYYVIEAETDDGERLSHLYEKPHTLTLIELISLAFNLEHFFQCPSCIFCMQTNDPNDRPGNYDCPGLDSTCQMFVGHGGDHSQ